MQRWRGLDQTPSGWDRCVATIGVFDGVHRGHQQIIERTVLAGRASALPSVVITFDPHPAEVVRPGSHPAILTSARYKAELIEALGIDALCTLPFTPEFSRLAPVEFVSSVLARRLHAAAVVVGQNFRFGHQAAGDVDVLRDVGASVGFSVEALALAGDAQTTVSSTYVRSRVAAGDLAAASWALTRPHRVEGVVVVGERRGRTLGYPTANVATSPYTAIPADGVYAGWLHRLGRPGAPAPAAISIGTNPTFAGQQRGVEAYALDAPADLDLYGELVGVDFVARLRDTFRFDSVEALVAEMSRDVGLARRRLGLAPS